MIEKYNFEKIIEEGFYSFIEEDINYISLGQVINKELVNYYIFDKNHKSIVGNIYRGRLQNKISSLNAFFVDIGTAKNGFYQPDKEKFDSLKESDEILLQVIYDGNSTKGPKLVDKYELKGESIILNPFNNNIKFSKKINNEDFKNDIINLCKKYNEYGFIFRTISQYLPINDIEKEIKDLIFQNSKIQKEKNFAPTPKLIYENNNFEKIIKKLQTPIITNSRDILKKYLQTDNIYLNEKFSTKNYDSLYKQIKELFKRKVLLNNGIEIIFDKTEAFNVIDINSKGFLNNSKYNLNKDTNKNCVKELIKHIHLRNMYGIILIDFISYNDKNEENELLELIKSEILKYENPLNIVGFTKLGY